MTKSLQNRLFKRFNYMFRERHFKPTQTCMCWGITTGDGWYDLLYILCEKIEDELKEDTKLKKAFAVTQVKEKFGGLRFYYNCGNDNIDKLVATAEKLASKTCEDCGSTKNVKLRGNSWVRTLCEKCNDMYLYKTLKATPTLHGQEAITFEKEANRNIKKTLSKKELKRLYKILGIK